MIEGAGSLLLMSAGLSVGWTILYLGLHLTLSYRKNCGKGSNRRTDYRWWGGSDRTQHNHQIR